MGNISRETRDNLLFFLASLENTPWLTQVGQPTEEDENLVRLDIDFVLNHCAELLEKESANDYEYWQDLLSAEETKFERIIFDNSLLEEQAKINSFVNNLRIEFDEDFYFNLIEKFDGYYADTFTYPHELLKPYLINRFIRGAACEILVGETDSTLKFFQKLMPWLIRGHWTYGWQGNYPAGKLMLW